MHLDAQQGEGQSASRDSLPIVVNDEARIRPSDPGLTLLDFLRGTLRLTGAKEACGRGECGACTVLVGGVPKLSCITLTARVREPVITIEGLAGSCEDLRRAFAEHGGFQCGFCTSGQIVHAAAILEAGLPAQRDEAERHLRHRLSGNICRCTGYAGILAAVLSVAEARGLIRKQPE